MIYVTHDQVEAMTMADRIVVLNAGRVAQVGPPLELYDRPADLFVAGFIGSPKMNLLEGRVVGVPGRETIIAAGKGVDIVAPRLARIPAEGEAVTIGIRPEHIEISEQPAPEALRMSVSLLEHLGAETMVHGTLENGHTLVVKAPGRAHLVAGQTIFASMPMIRCHVFDRDGKANLPIVSASQSSLLGQ